MNPRPPIRADRSSPNCANRTAVESAGVRLRLFLPRPQSLAITGGYLSVEESGDEESDGITPRLRSTLVPVIPLSPFSLVSRVREFPNPHLVLGSLWRRLRL